MNIVLSVIVVDLFSIAFTSKAFVTHTSICSTSSVCNKLLQVIAAMVLAIIAASFSAVMFSASVAGIFAGRDDERPDYNEEENVSD